jgi:hypothetical protein
VFFFVFFFVVFASSWFRRRRLRAVRPLTAILARGCFSADNW